MKNLFIALGLSSVMVLGGCSAENANKPPTNTNETVQNNKTEAMEEQSKATMEVATKYMDAMGKGDMETMVSLMDENMVWQNEGDKSLPWLGPWEGKKNILENFLPLFMENFKTVKWDTEDAISSGEVAAFFGQMKGVTLKSGQETTEFTFALRVRVVDGKIVLWNWLEDSYAVSQAYHNQ